MLVYDNIITLYDLTYFGAKICLIFLVCDKLITHIKPSKKYYLLIYLYLFIILSYILNLLILQILVLIILSFQCV